MTKTVEICVDMLAAIEHKYITLDDGEYLIYNPEECCVELSYCPFCGRELINYERLAMGDIPNKDD
jgi:hypothetical protein